MARAFNFNGRQIVLPGVYTQVDSGVNNGTLNFSYGNILIIDTREDSLFSGGSGINGEFGGGEDSIYCFDNIRGFRTFIGGGELYELAQPLFRPFGSGSQGISQLKYIKAMTTTAAAIDLTFAAGAITIKAKNEGLAGNGVETSSILTQGHSVTLQAGLVDPSKFIVKFWRGGYTGLAADGISYDGNTPEDSNPLLITQSSEVDTIEGLTTWMANSFDFNASFALSANTVTGAITAADLTALVGNQLFSGGTQVADATSFDEVLDTISELDFTFILSLDSNTDVLSANNFKILSHLENEARYEKFLVVAGGDNKNEFQSLSVIPAQTYNSDRVILVHGGVYENDFNSATNQRIKSSLHKAAYLLGRTAGLEPQTPVTFKGLGYAAEVHKLTTKEKTIGLQAGVLTTYYDTEIGAFVVTQGVNTLQNNDFVVLPKGQSFSIQLKRIAAQLNKELEINAKRQLLGNQSQGPNRATLSEEVVVEWVKEFLKKRTATQTVDNLILSFQDISVGVEGDAYFVNYGFVPNFEVNKLFFTGLILDPNS